MQEYSKQLPDLWVVMFDDKIHHTPFILESFEAHNSQNWEKRLRLNQFIWNTHTALVE